jgi:hypothetical protein
MVEILPCPIVLLFTIGATMPFTIADISALSGFVRTPDKPCRICKQAIDPRRVVLEKTTCLECQQDLDITEPVKHLIAIPYNKGAYQYIHDPKDLFNTNPKEPRV